MLESVKLFGANILNYVSADNMDTVRTYYFSVLDLLYSVGHDELADQLREEFTAVVDGIIARK